MVTTTYIHNPANLFNAPEREVSSHTIYQIFANTFGALAAKIANLGVSSQLVPDVLGTNLVT